MIIDGRFRGPPHSANGGYACGVVAGLLGDIDAEATLRAPPAVDRELTGKVENGKALLLDGDALVAEAVPTVLSLEVPPAVSFAEAEHATATYPWRTTHPMGMCFVCGPDRADGLRIFPGKVDGRQVAAAPWIPDATLVAGDGLVAREIVWAALDCPSWFGHLCFEPSASPLILLGRLAAHVESRPRVGEKCVTLGWFLERSGRKITCGSALYGEDGRLHGFGRAVWIELKTS
jgi:hypothetical protein